MNEIRLRTDWDILGFLGFHRGMTIWFVWVLSITIEMMDTDCYGLFMIVIVEIGSHRYEQLRCNIE